MTNGEKVKEIFGVSQVDEGELYAYAWLPNHNAAEISIDWWNAEYKEPVIRDNGVKNELNRVKDELEPTIKNDLGVDCISRAYAIQAMQDTAKKLTNEDTINGLCGAVAILFDLPSVTPQEPRWIPVSERLPKDKETVLVTFKHFISGNTIGLGSVILLRGKPHWHVREQNLGTYDAIAWMPLPKYEPQESENP